MHGGAGISSVSIATFILDKSVDGWTEVMDIYCPLCGEPWDNDTLHEVAQEEHSTYREVARAFRQTGCAALGASCNRLPDRDTAELSSAMMDMMGDDMDGVAAMMEDARWMDAIR